MRSAAVLAIRARVGELRATEVKSRHLELRAFTGLLRPLSDEAPTRARTEFRPLSNAPSTAVGGVLVGAQYSETWL